VSVIAGVTILLGLLLLLLAIPIDIAFNVHGAPRISGKINFRWLFGLLRFNVAIPVASTGKRKPHKSKRALTNKRTRGMGKAGSNKWLTAFKQPDFRKRAFQFIKDLLQAMHSRDIRILLRIGLDNPADTGRLWAILGPVAAIALNIRSVALRLEPAFLESVFEIRGRGEFRLIPLEFLFIATAFLLSPPSVRAWRGLGRGNA
jgi:hypothetical protein